MELITHGFVAPGFDQVAAEFERNFKERGETGAAVAVYYRGEKVVDLWGGYRDAAHRQPWKEDTLIVSFSITKGMVALALALAHARGWLDYDAPVARYWPGFGQAGKENVTVRQLIDHEAGLVLLDERLDLATLARLDDVAAILARQKPLWVPGSRHGYHVWTMGLYMNELLRRVDPRHRSVGRFFQEEISKPLGLDFYIGLPDSVPSERLASIEMLTFFRGMWNSWKVPPGERSEILNPWSLLNKALVLPPGMDPNSRDALRIEFASLNGVGTVRSIAAAFSAFVTGGGKLGLTPENVDVMCTPPHDPPGGPHDQVLGLDSYFSHGFEKPPPDLEFGWSRRAIGHSGAGGSFAFADPDRQVAYAFVTNHLDFYGHGDPRDKALRAALSASIDRLEAK
jgi:CubicO group peptidase (beta-lactamase class C family)